MKIGFLVLLAQLSLANDYQDVIDDYQDDFQTEQDYNSEEIFDEVDTAMSGTSDEYATHEKIEDFEDEEQAFLEENRESDLYSDNY